MTCIFCVELLRHLNEHLTVDCNNWKIEISNCLSKSIFIKVATHLKKSLRVENLSIALQIGIHKLSLFSSEYEAPEQDYSYFQYVCLRKFTKYVLFCNKKINIWKHEQITIQDRYWNSYKQFFSSNVVKNRILRWIKHHLYWKNEANLRIKVIIKNTNQYNSKICSILKIIRHNSLGMLTYVW